MTAQTDNTQLGLVDRLLIAAGERRSPHDILRDSLAIVLDACGQCLGCIYLLENGHLTLAIVQGQAESEAPKQFSPDDSRLWQQCSGSTARRAPLTRGETSGELEHWIIAQGYDQMLMLPLLARHEEIGCLFVAANDGDGARLERESWDTVGRIIGLGFETARSNSRVKRQLHNTETLYQVSQAFSATLALDDLLNLIVRSAVDTIAEADNCVLHLLIPETGELRPRALSFDRIIDNGPSRSQMRIGHGVAGKALEKGEVVNVADVANDPRFVRVEQARRFSSMLVVPLRLKERPLGTLSVDSQRGERFYR